MTPLSVEYCKRARGHLAALGSPLAAGAAPSTEPVTVPFSALARTRSVRDAAAIAPQPKSRQATSLGGKAQQASVTPPRRPERLRLASLGQLKLSETQALALRRAREAERFRAENRRQMWAEHTARLNVIAGKIKPARLNIMTGL